MKKILFLCIPICLVAFFLCNPQGLFAAQEQNDVTTSDVVADKSLSDDAKKVMTPTNQDIMKKMHSSAITGIAGKMGIDMVMSLLDSSAEDAEAMFKEIITQLGEMQKSMDHQFDQMSEEIASAQLSDIYAEAG